MAAVLTARLHTAGVKQDPLPGEMDHLTLSEANHGEGHAGSNGGGGEGDVEEIPSAEGLLSGVWVPPGQPTSHQQVDDPPPDAPSIPTLLSKSLVTPAITVTRHTLRQYHRHN